MSKIQEQSSTYTKFLKFVQAVRDVPAFPALDPVEERLLNQLAAKWHVGTKVTVLEAMGMSSDVSAATVHRRLKSLRQKGMLTMTGHEADARIRYLTATSLTIKYFAKMGQCLSRALRS